MKLFARSNDTDQYIVALDIGTEYTKALIAKLVDDELRVIATADETAADEIAKSDEAILLEEIRDLLKKQK